MTDPDTWTRFGQAPEFYRWDLCQGIRKILSPDGPFAGLDLDGVSDPDRGGNCPGAAGIVEGLNGYTDVSPARSRPRIFVRGRFSGTGINRKFVEVYDWPPPLRTGKARRLPCITDTGPRPRRPARPCLAYGIVAVGGGEGGMPSTTGIPAIGAAPGATTGGAVRM